MTATCIFCGGTPTTNEHLFPRWTLGWLERIKPLPTSPDVVVRSLQKRGLEGRPETESQWSTDAEATFKTNCVCQPCNGGWMKRIEDDAAPVLLEMMEDRPLALSRADERKVADWLGLKSIITQYTLGHFPGDWAQQFYADKRPPDVWKIRIGRYDGSHTLNAQLSELTITGKHWLSPFDVKRTDLFLCVLLMGHFIGQVIGSRTMVGMDRIPRYFVPIWPPPLVDVDNPVRPFNDLSTWPPGGTIDDVLFDKIVHDATEPKE